ncbi:C-terminal binding protein [Cellulosimicrobium cellulans]|uniref:C-terminal binding protein n=1 Tax=Cellulosimicrobium cellulans TaxID=1710 RepID=UPI001962695A|nr:C-terminal binding protein [Cellulosimicrobium cellulans]MBN0042094.1 C-terminal binding protein [Cellulosimicrobium cellulans]
MTADTVVITDCDLPGTACEDTLTAAGLRAVRAAARTEDEVIAAVEEAAASGSVPSALVVQWAPITARVLDAVAGPGGVRMVSRMGIGYDMVDVAAATERGVAVANTPTYCIEEVASHTVAMILTLDRGLVAYDRALRAGTWAPTAQHAARLSSTVVAVIGYGRIGSEVARSARALGYRVLVHDPFVDPQAVASDGHEAVGIDEAVARADVITLHAPLTDSTRHLLDARTLATAKPGVRVVNTCRGPLIDEDALADALASGHVGSAALDVYATEPLPADSRLRTLDNVLLTPHAAWFSPEAMQDLPVHTARNAVDFLAGRPVPSIVNPDHARALA